MSRGCFLSDLHLLSPRSDWDRRQVHWERDLSQADLIVFGGDIFDFRWSHHADHEATLHAVELRLWDWIERFPAGRMVYLLGNHDSHPDIEEVLEKTSAGCDRFSWQREVYAEADCVFCHGDMLDAGGCGPELRTYRSTFHHELPPSPWAHRAYDLIVAARIHRAVPALRHRPLASCQRLATYLWLGYGETMTTAKRVFFGHTHVPIAGLQVEGLEFFNPGASLRHLPFAPVMFELDNRG